MKDADLVSLIDRRVNDDIFSQGQYRSDNQKFFDYYNQELFGDEEDGLSSVVTRDVGNLVDSDQISLARTFLGASPPVQFEPILPTDEAIQESEDMNKYIPWIISSVPNSYKKQSDWLKDISLQSSGWVEYGIEECESVETDSYEDLSREEIVLLLDSLALEKDVKSVEITEEVESTMSGVLSQTFDITVTINKEKKKYFINNIPWEDMIIPRGIQIKNDADVFGKRFRKRKGDLVALGIPEEKVKKLPVSGAEDGDYIKEDRFQSQGGDEVKVNESWPSDEVDGVDVIVLADFKGDGRLERHRIIKVKNTILLDEPFDHIPYAGCSAIQMPHNIIGKSRAEITCPYQREHSVLMRNMNDNIYSIGQGRAYIDDSVVNMDDMLDIKKNGLVRTTGNPAAGVMPEPIPYHGDKMLQVIQYGETLHAQATGVQLANQALTSDQLNQETATRFEGVEKAALGKIELVARNIAEIAYRDLYEGLAWFARHYQDSEQEVYVLGKELKIKPSSWRFEHNVSSQVGTGAGDDEKTLQTLGSILALQQGEIEKGSGLADISGVYTTYQKIIKAANLNRADIFFNDPSQPQEMVFAENQMLKQAVQQLQTQVQERNMLAEAESVKQQTEVLKASLKSQETQRRDAIKAAEVQQDMQQFLLNLAQDKNQFNQDMVKDITELSLKYGVDLPGDLVR